MFLFKADESDRCVHEIHNQDFMALKYTVYHENTLFPIKLVLDIFLKSRKRRKNVFPVIVYIFFSRSDAF